jgi:hypothetical protein
MAGKQPMPTARMARRSRFRLRALGICLCAAVFAWGLQAKISQYHHAAPLNPAHVAKLMVDNQGSKGSAAATTGHGSRPRNVVWIGLVSPAPPASARLDENERLPHPAAPAHTHALFFRPPPQAI